MVAGQRQRARRRGGHDGRLLNGTGFSIGKVGSAFQFDGADDRVRVPAAPALDLGQSAAGFTIDLWQLSTRSYATQVMAAWHNGSAYGFHLYRDQDAVCVQAIDLAGQPTWWPSAARSEPGNWEHVAVTYEPARGGLVSIFVNGVIRTQQAIGPVQVQTSYDLYLGGTPEGVTYFGQLDEVTLYRRPLDGQEVWQLFQTGSVGKCPVGANRPPLVSAGPARAVPAAGGSITLEGSVSDDGLPAGNALRVAWVAESVPAGAVVNFALPYQAQTTATFTAPGLYILRLTADDGEAQASDRVEVRVGLPCSNAPAGLVAWWPLNDDARDVVGGNDGRLLNGAAFTAGKVGPALGIDGADDRMRVPAAPALDLGASAAGFTIELWETSTRYYATQVLAAWHNGSAFGVHLYRDQDAIWLAAIDTSGVRRNVAVGGVVGTGSWEHVTATYDRARGQMTIFVNGTPRIQQAVGDLRLKPRGTSMSAARRRVIHASARSMK